MSGIEPSPELEGLFQDMKLRARYLYATFSLVPTGVDSANKRLYDWVIHDTVAAGGTSVGKKGTVDAATKGTVPARAQVAPPGGGPSLDPTAATATTTTIAAPATLKSATTSKDENAVVWQDMADSLPSDQGRFILFDWRSKASDGRILAKVLLIKWCPDSLHIADKMIMASTYQTLKERFVGLGRDIQAADPADLEFSAVAQAVGQV